jgi:hypothetical protein
MLVSSNSRPLGRSPRWFGDLAECEAAVRELGARAGELTPTVTAVSGTGQWQWRISAETGPIAVSTRTYLRQHECEYNVRRFIEAVPEARFVAGLRFINGR